MNSQLVCLGKAHHPKVASPDEIPYILVNDFNDKAVDKFFYDFMKMTSDDNVLIIPIIISSYGGQVHSLLAMLDIIESSVKPVATIAIGKAMSCGAFLLAAGDPGLRFVGPNAEIMLHEISSKTGEKVTEAGSDLENTKKLNVKVLQKLAKQTKKKDKDYYIKEMKKRMMFDWILTAEETKKLGLADHVSVPIFTRQD